MSKTDSEIKFIEAVTQTLMQEGGFSNHEHDMGGATKFGISLRFLRGITPEGARTPLISDIETLTESDAINLYRTYFWGSTKYNHLHDQAVINKVFDLSVNMGGYPANRILQKAINASLNLLMLDLGSHSLDIPHIDVDGIAGWITITTANWLHPIKLIEALRLEAEQHYLRIVENNPSQEVFLKGWLARARS